MEVILFALAEIIGQPLFMAFAVIFAVAAAFVLVAYALRVFLH